MRWRRVGERGSTEHPPPHPLQEHKLEWLRAELKSETDRAKGMWDAQAKAEAVRAKQLLEGLRGPEAVTRLQDQLHLAVAERERALALPRGARNAVERMRLEHEKAELLKTVRMDIFRIREALLEEGRRRRYLYEEEQAFSQAELRRLRDLHEMTKERTECMRMIFKNYDDTGAAREALSEAMMDELEASPVELDE